MNTTGHASKLTSFHLQVWQDLGFKMTPASQLLAAAAAEREPALQATLESHARCTLWFQTVAVFCLLSAGGRLHQSVYCLGRKPRQNCWCSPTDTRSLTRMARYRIVTSLPAERQGRSGCRCARFGCSQAQGRPHGSAGAAGSRGRSCEAEKRPRRRWRRERRPVPVHQCDAPTTRRGTGAVVSWPRELQFSKANAANDADSNLISVCHIPATTLRSL